MTSDLTDDEREALDRIIRWHLNCHVAEPGGVYLGLCVSNVILRVEALIAARVAEALTKQAEDIATAIRSEVEPVCIDGNTGGACSQCATYYAAARIAREFGQQKEADRG